MANVPADSSARPQPIIDAFKSVGVALSGLGGVVTTLVTLGVLSTDQGDSVTDLLNYGVSNADVLSAIVAGAVTIGAGLVASFGTGKTAQARVTPIEDPRDNDGTSLVPAWVVQPSTDN